MLNFEAHILHVAVAYIDIASERVILKGPSN
jgi:hypothetical protein